MSGFVVPARSARRGRWLALLVLLAVTTSPAFGGQTAPSTLPANRALIRAGDTREIIVAHLGQPRSIASRGTLTFLEYPEGRIVLEDGRATEIPPALQAPSATPAPPPNVPTGSPPQATSAPPAATAAATTPPAQAPAATVATAPGSAPIALPDWFTSIADAQRASLQTVRPLVVVFLGSAWNPASQQLRAQVLAQPELQEHARNNWVGLMIDLPKDLPENPPEWMQAYADFAKKYDVTSYPTIVVLGQGGIEHRRVAFTGQAPADLIAAIDGKGAAWSFRVPPWAWSVPIFALVYLAFRWWDKSAQRRKAAAGLAPEFDPAAPLGQAGATPPPVPSLAPPPSVDLTSVSTRPSVKPPLVVPHVPLKPPTPPVFRKPDATKPPLPMGAVPPPPPGLPPAPSLSEALAAAAAFAPAGQTGSPPPPPPPPMPPRETAHPLPPLPKLPERAAFAPPPPPPPGAFGPAPATPGGGLMGAEPPPEDAPAPKSGAAVLEAHRPKLVMPKPASAKPAEAPAKPAEAAAPKPAESPPAPAKPSLRLARKSEENPSA